MSWSIAIIGHPAKIDAKLAELSNKFDSQTKVEFDDALPHLSALVRQNWNPADQEQPVIKLEASGHGYAVNGDQKQRTLKASIESFWATIV